MRFFAYHGQLDLRAQYRYGKLVSIATNQRDQSDRPLLRERGIRFVKGGTDSVRQKPEVLGNADEKAPQCMHCPLDSLWQAWKHQLQSERLSEESRLNSDSVFSHWE
jgi:hypothetical protein